MHGETVKFQKLIVPTQ